MIVYLAMKLESLFRQYRVTYFVVTHLTLITFLAYHAHIQKLLSQRFSNDYALKELVSTMLSSPSFLYISDSVISKMQRLPIR